MPQTEAADFFDQHLSKMLVAPSFEQAPPTLPPGAGWTPNLPNLQAGESEASTQSSEHRQWQAPPTDYGESFPKLQVSRDLTASSSGENGMQTPHHAPTNAGGYGTGPPGANQQHVAPPAPPPAAPDAQFEPAARLPAPPPSNLQRATKQASSMAIDPMSSQALLPECRYKVKDHIEVWSNTHSRWCPGTVESIDGVKIGVKYSSPDGAAMTKQMPESHEHLRLASSTLNSSQNQAMASTTSGYKVGDEIQIWSNSQQAWCDGFVEKFEGELLSVKYSSLDGQSMTKLMPDGHEYLRLKQGSPPPPPPMGQGEEMYAREEENVDDYMSHNMSNVMASASGSATQAHLSNKGRRSSAAKNEEEPEFVAETTSWTGNGGGILCGMPVKAKKATPLNADGTPVARCPDTERCCRCSMPVGSYFDHACPRCEGIVCLACLDDIKLIVGSYRCPHCGDQRHNEESLKNTIWYLNVYRSAQRAVGAVPILVAGLFGYGPEGNAKRTSKQACAMEEEEESENLGPPAPAPRKRSVASKGGPPPPPPPRPKAKAATREVSSEEPEYHTRPPAGWEEGGAAWLGKGQKVSTNAPKGQGSRPPPPPPPPAPGRQQQDGRRSLQPFESSNGAFKTRVPQDMKSPQR